MSKVEQFIRDLHTATYGVLPEREHGQTNVEYALILFLVAVVAAAVLLIMGGKIKDVLESVNASL
jgi:Flp pilus assembly pilin Flp